MKLLNTFFRSTALIAVVIWCAFPLYSQDATEKQLLKSITNEKDETHQFLLKIRLGEFYLKNNIRKADSLKHQLLAESRVYDDYIRFRALFFSAEVNEVEGNQEEYFKDILACQPFLNKLHSDEVTFQIYRHLGYYHSFSHEFEQAAFYLNFARDLALKKRNNAQVAEADDYLALNYMFQNKKDSALYYSDQAIQYGRRTSRKEILAESFNIQARIYYYFGQIELSVAKNIVALELATELNNWYLMASYLREIGESQLLINNLDEAAFYFNRSLEYAEKIADYRQTGLSLTNLGTVYYQRKQYDKAIDYTKKAIKILSHLNDENGLGSAYTNLGLIYLGEKKYNKASIHFNQALVYFESTGNKEKIAEVYHNVGIVFQKQKKYQNALTYLQRSISIREQFGSKGQIYNTYRVISEVYKETGNDHLSLEYLQRYVNFLDSNTLVQSATKIAELNELYRSEQRERLILSQADSIERQRQEKVLTAAKLENSQLRNNFQMYIILGLMIIAVLAGIILFYRWNQTTIKQQQREAEMSQTLLRAQMNPHFVFNAMSVIQSYIYENDTVNSSRFLVNFSRLMRLILENSSKEFIPLETEMEILQKYLETQKLRFEDRFDFRINISDDIVVEQTLIPPMITQPFIENAIEHGQLHTIEGGFIHIAFTRAGDILNVLIEDNGIGRKGAEVNKKSKAHKSMAMNITRERIDNLNKKYKTEGHLIVEDYNKTLKTGTKVLISLPYKQDENLK